MKAQVLMICVDHAGEQINKVLKSDGGLYGAASNANARTRLLLIAPLITQISEELKSGTSLPRLPLHRQLSKAFLEKQKSKTSKLEVSIRLHGNPFVQKEFKSLYNIVTKSEGPEKFQHGILNVEVRGQQE